tara:strand:+ start:34 stop:1113 length:1080 start_codon:yes stop_codon:yes gene_type:complete
MALAFFGTLDLDVVAAQQYKISDARGKFGDKEINVQGMFRYLLRKKGSRKRAESQWVESNDMTQDERSLFFFLAESKNMIHQSMEQYSPFAVQERADLHEKHESWYTPMQKRPPSMRKPHNAYAAKKRRIEKAKQKEEKEELARLRQLRAEEAALEHHDAGRQYGWPPVAHRSLPPGMTKRKRPPVLATRIMVLHAEEVGLVEVPFVPSVAEAPMPAPAPVPPPPTPVSHPVAPAVLAAPTDLVLHSVPPPAPPPPSPPPPASEEDDGFFDLNSSDSDDDSEDDENVVISTLATMAQKEPEKEPKQEPEKGPEKAAREEEEPDDVEDEEPDDVEDAVETEAEEEEEEDEMEVKVDSEED